MKKAPGRQREERGGESDASKSSPPPQPPPPSSHFVSRTYQTVCRLSSSPVSQLKIWWKRELPKRKIRYGKKSQILVWDILKLSVSNFTKHTMQGTYVHGLIPTVHSVQHKSSIFMHSSCAMQVEFNR